MTKGCDFNFSIVSFSFIWGNSPAAVSAYGVYISQLIQYSRACGSYHDFLDRGLLLTRKLLNQGFLVVKLEFWLKVARHLWNMTTDLFRLSSVITARSFPRSWLIIVLVKRATREWAFLTTWVHARLLVGFVLLKLVLCSVL